MPVDTATDRYEILNHRSPEHRATSMCEGTRAKTGPQTLGQQLNDEVVLFLSGESKRF
jgi:hypothetical protein